MSIKDADISAAHPDFLQRVKQILTPQQILAAASERWAYSYDNSRQQQQPGVVLLPHDARQVSDIIALCNTYKIPLTARGHGTGTAGAAVPPPGGVSLSMEHMNRILGIDPDNRVMTVQPGVTNQAVQQAAAEHGFFWPPDPTSMAVCTVGGNLACNAAGPRAVKYGTPRDNVLGLQFVTATGSLLNTGVYTTKGVVGYDLTRLLIGSEGTLAVITEATLKLTPLPEDKRTLRAIYRDTESAARAISAIMAQPVTPSALEFMDNAAIDMIRDDSRVDLPLQAGALLMIEVDGPAECIAHSAEKIAAVARNSGCLELREAASEDEVKALWSTRKALSPALRKVAPKKINEDVVVPVSRLPELVNGLTALADKYAISIVNFGHAGNGNIHVNLLVDPDDPQQMAAADNCLDEVFTLVLQLDGTLSGEHGIGLVKREFVGRELDAASLELMQQLKRLFDPNNILNPGKTLPGI